MFLPAIRITSSSALNPFVLTIASANHLEEGMGIGCPSLQLNSKSRKQQDLDRGTGGVL
jgi:hypothetical protein